MTKESDRERVMLCPKIEVERVDMGKCSVKTLVRRSCFEEQGKTQQLRGKHQQKMSVNDLAKKNAMAVNVVTSLKMAGRLEFHKAGSRVAYIASASTATLWHFWRAEKYLTA